MSRGGGSIRNQEMKHQVRVSLISRASASTKGSQINSQQRRKTVLYVKVKEPRDPHWLPPSHSHFPSPESVTIYVSLRSVPTFTSTGPAAWSALEYSQGPSLQVQAQCLPPPEDLPWAISSLVNQQTANCSYPGRPTPQPHHAWNRIGAGKYQLLFHPDHPTLLYHPPHPPQHLFLGPS